jgi:uncharacterized protein YaaW (UPF0174 family)
VDELDVGQKNNMNTKKITAALMIPCILLSSCKESAVPPKSNTEILPNLKTSEVLAKNSYWGPKEWRYFISSLNDSNLVELAIAYGALQSGTPGISDKGQVLDAKMSLNFNSGRDAVIAKMEMNAMNAFWSRTEKAATVFTNPGYHVQWHELVKRACYFTRMEGVDYDKEYSFEAEQNLFKKLVSDTWDRMTKEQRAEAIKNSESLSQLSEEQKSAIMVGGGGVLIATLSTTVMLSGFAFYTTMSSVICASAGALGLTLPFGAYMGASSTVALLSGPVGWTVAAIAIIGSAISLFNDPDKEQLIKIVLATHMMKAKVSNGDPTSKR